MGTGFFISKEGHILTNTNVTNGADRVWVECNGVACGTEQVGHDPVTNISIIKLIALPPNYTFLRFSENQSPAAIGSLLVGITCELGLDPGPTIGLVKGWNTNYGERVLPTVFLRTDIAADGGEGGGPVFDLNGNLVGMMVVALPEIRSSFVLPARAVNRIMDDILLSGEVKYAYFGFQSKAVGNIESGPRVVIEKIEQGGPADNAGIKVGDYITKIGDYKIDGDSDLRVASFFTQPDRFVEVLVDRDGENVRLQMKVGTRELPTDVPIKSQESSSNADDAPIPMLVPENALMDEGIASENALMDEGIASENQLLGKDSGLEAVIINEVEK